MERPPGMDLDQRRIRMAASFAAAKLRSDGVARVRLTPGDMTVYPILIAAPGIEFIDERAPRPGRDYWVALCSSFGGGYFWSGQESSPDYAAAKWTSNVADGTRMWTGWVISDFLNALAEYLNGDAQQDEFWAEHPGVQS